jgi:ABC-type uncharacterized transport system involved in gliding motility auxiliary subunit
MAMRIDRLRAASIAYVLGPILLLAAGLKYVLQLQFDLWVQIGLAAGVICLAAGVLLDPERWRKALGGRQARYGSNALVLGLAFFGILVVLNVVAVNNPQRIDLTEDQEYSLAPESLLLLEELSQPVRFKGFYTPENSAARERLRPLLEEYRIKSSGQITYEFIDPRANPLAADQYGITRDGSMAVVMGEASQLVEFPSERDLTSAIVRLLNPESRVVYFLQGEGERPLEGTDDSGLSQLKDSLESKNYSVSPLNLPVQGSVPEDALVLIAAGPTSEFSTEVVTLLQEYLESGGAMVLLLDPVAREGSAQQGATLEAYLARSWGVRPRGDFIVDLASIFPFNALSASYGSHSITERLNELNTAFPAARSLELLELADPGSRTATPLVQTSERSWGETDYEAISAGANLGFDEGAEAAGPLTVAAAVEDFQSGARLVVVGDSDFAANRDFFTGGNGDLIVNSIDWAAKQDELISITPKERTQRTVLPGSRETVILLLLLTVVVIPGGVVAAGVAVWWSRRKRG